MRNGCLISLSTSSSRGDHILERGDAGGCSDQERSLIDVHWPGTVGREHYADGVPPVVEVGHIVRAKPPGHAPAVASNRAPLASLQYEPLECPLVEQKFELQEDAQLAPA